MLLTPKIICKSCLCAVALAALTACSIKVDVPDFKYPSRTDYSDQNWPELVLTEDLIAAEQVTGGTLTEAHRRAAALEARARWLRARAKTL